MKSKFNKSISSFDSDLNENSLIQDFQQHFKNEIDFERNQEHIFYEQANFEKTINDIFLKEYLSRGSFYDYIYQFFSEGKNANKVDLSMFLNSLKKYFYSERKTIKYCRKILAKNSKKKFCKLFFQLNNLLIRYFEFKLTFDKEDVKYFFKILLNSNVITKQIKENLMKISQDKKISKLKFLYLVTSKIHRTYSVKIKSEVYYSIKKELKKILKKFMFFKFKLDNFKDKRFFILFDHIIIYWKIIYFNNQRLWQRCFGIDDYQDLENFQKDLTQINFKDLQISNFSILIFKNLYLQNLLGQLIQIHYF